MGIFCFRRCQKSVTLIFNMATPHHRQREKIPSPELGSMKKEELSQLCQSLLKKSRDLEEINYLISKGKYIWESTFDAISDPVMIVTPGFEVVRANLAMAKTCGHDITKVTGQKCHEIFADRSSPCPGCPLNKTVESQQKSDATLKAPIHHCEFHAYAYPLFNDKGELESTVMYYRDITEESRLRQEIIQQEKMAAIGMLAGGVAHEINNPLGGVLAFTQLLLKRADGKNDPLYEDLKEIEFAATRCKKIVQDLLDFSRTSKDKEKTPVQVNEQIRRLDNFIQMEMKSLNIDLTYDLDLTIPPVMAVPNRLQQVFLNLMTNAVQAMPQGGKMSVRTFFDASKKEVCIEVEDSGNGVPVEIQNRIFEPFFTTKEPGKGTGLGLAISYRIVKESEGTIDLDTEEAGGTIFRVRLPSAVD